MARPTDLDTRLAQLGLAARLRLAVIAAIAPMGVAALLALAFHMAASLKGDTAVQEGRVAELAYQGATLLRAAGGGQAQGRSALAALRSQMRDVAALSGDGAVRAAAQALTLATYDHESGKAGAPPLPPLLDKLAAAATRAAALARAGADTWSGMALAVMLLAPVAAAAGGLVLARRITRGIDGTLRECIAFAGDIAAGNFQHGGAQARPGARARHMDAPADSASEFDVLVRSMNSIAEETLAAAQREVERIARLERVERSWALLSACSRSLVTASGEAALTDALCRHLVELGGYRIAWVGYARDDDARTIEPVSHAGTDRAYIDGLQLSWGADVHRQGGFGTAIVQRRVLVCKDMHGDLVFTSWKSVAPPHGVQACIALPLAGQAGAFGVLGLYTDDASTLFEDEIRLLQDLADDLAFGIASRRDHAVREQVEDELAHHTHYDGLTGLATVATLRAQLAEALGPAPSGGDHGRAGRGAAGARHAEHAHHVHHVHHAHDGPRKTAALHVNIDRFRDVNAKHGREAGDRLLVAVARRLQQACGPHALLARAGADEFIAVLPAVAGAGTAAETASRVVAALGEALPLDGVDVHPQASVGISLHPDDGGDADTLLRHAAEAMQDAKREGGHTWRFRAADTNARMAPRLAMETELQGALERGELLLQYQPQCSLVTGAVTGVEALLRWRHPSRGLLAPHEFLRVAEETGLSPAFGAWAIDAVCARIHAWRNAGLHVPPVALNLAPRQFHHPALADTVRAALLRHQVPEKALELEVTEAALMRDPESGIATLRALRGMGVRIALDDFGAGYSSLNQLRRMPVDHVKIDAAFVQGMVASADDASACNAIIALAHSLHFGVIAEGVETEEQMNYLRRRHCDAMQGFLFSRPLAPDALAALLASGRRLELADHGAPRHTVLLLDDAPAVVRALNRALRQDGYRILAATGTADALKLLANNPVHVVLADQDMPGMTGVQFMQTVKELYPATHRIILSTYTGLEPVIAAINRGTIHRFFAKPWHDDELRACIASTLGPGVH